jgi:hypothetical protein
VKRLNETQALEQIGRAAELLGNWTFVYLCSLEIRAVVKRSTFPEKVCLRKDSYPLLRGKDDPLRIGLDLPIF